MERQVPPSRPPIQQQGIADAPLQTRVDGLVYAYRTMGHTIAHTDPLAKHRPENPLLKLSEFGFTDKDLEMTVGSKFLFGGKPMRLREMVTKLESIYSGNVGFEFMHIRIRECGTGCVNELRTAASGVWMQKRRFACSAI
jgi:2-oxoglutarate dehydrogenase E1 component